jgi:hypothetical protein
MQSKKVMVLLDLPGQGVGAMKKIRLVGAGWCTCYRTPLLLNADLHPPLVAVAYGQSSHSGCENQAEN